MAVLPIGDAKIGLVVGSGLAGCLEAFVDARATPYAKIPGFPVSSVPGHAGELLVGRLGGVPVAALSGRAHYYEGHPMEKIVAGVRALVRSGVKAVVLTNAAGGIRRSLRPGDLMLITDHINGFGTNPLIGANDETLGPRFPDMSFVYDRQLRRMARAAARRLRIPIREGVYVGLYGPSYETPAEIRMWGRLGAHAVGMSTVPEAIELCHAGVRVLGISAISNMAAGIRPRPLDHDDVMAVGAKTAMRLARLLQELMPRLDADVRN